MQVANWRMEKLEVDSKSGSDEEFYDCIGEFNQSSHQFTVFTLRLVCYFSFFCIQIKIKRQKSHTKSGYD